MSFELQGYGYEFDTKHYGGPYDGLDSSVIAFQETPPIIIFYPADTTEEAFQGEKSLGKKLLNKWKEPHYPDTMRVAVYRLEGDPEEYNDDDIIPYHFQEIIPYSNYKEKYK